MCPRWVIVVAEVVVHTVALDGGGVVDHVVVVADAVADAVVVVVEAVVFFLRMKERVRVGGVVHFLLLLLVLFATRLVPFVPMLFVVIWQLVRVLPLVVVCSRVILPLFPCVFYHFHATLSIVDPMPSKHYRLHNNDVLGSAMVRSVVDSTYFWTSVWRVLSLERGEGGGWEVILHSACSLIVTTAGQCQCR